MPDYTENKKTDISEKKKEVSSVVARTPKTRKKSEVSRFANSIMSGDSSSVKRFLYEDVLIPSMKKLIDDIVTNGISIILYGEAGRSKKSSSPGTRVPYSGYYSDRRDNPPRSIRDGGVLDYEDIIFDNRGDAETVLASMDEILSQYGIVTVLDLFDLSGVTTHNYMAARYGWKNIRDADVIRVRDGYIIRLPRAIPIDR